ncbi:MAG: hypothetical protein U0802_01625 [Candidatus Binatia bacterium]
MPLWALLALAAETLRTARNALSRSFAFTLSPALNSWARFAFNLPFSGSLVLALGLAHGAPALPPAFFAGCLLTALTQLLGNVALVAAFRHGNFAQAIALHKLEVGFSALIGALLFAEHPTPVSWLELAACSAGVLVVNLGRVQGPAGWRRAAPSRHRHRAGDRLRPAVGVGQLRPQGGQRRLRRRQPARWRRPPRPPPARSATPPGSRWRC